MYTTKKVKARLMPGFFIEVTGSSTSIERLLRRTLVLSAMHSSFISRSKRSKVTTLRSLLHCDRCGKSLIRIVAVEVCDATGDATGRGCRLHKIITGAPTPACLSHHYQTITLNRYPSANIVERFAIFMRSSYCKKMKIRNHKTIDYG